MHVLGMRKITLRKCGQRARYNRWVNFTSNYYENGAVMVLTKIDQGLQRATPESQGIASSAVLAFIEAVESQVHELHSFMLVRHGKVVAEGWWSPYGRDIPHMLFSLSKSFTSTAVGLAIAEGFFSLDDAVISFFPDEKPADVSANLAAMQVRHLLSMSTGHDVDTMPALTQQADGVWTRGFFEVPVVHKPGTHFLYNTGASYMLSVIVQKTTGMKLNDFLEPRLYAPLGIENAVWEISPQGFHMGGFGLNITTEDIAKFGQLYLQKGVWQGNRILSEAWVEEATSFQIANNGGTLDWQQGYGYQFWRCQHNGYRGDGAFGQYCVVLPELDAVVAITAGLPDMQQPLDLVWGILLPAMGDILPDDPVGHDQLTEKLASLNISPVPGKKSSAQAGKVSGKTYTLEANELNIESIGFDQADSSVTIKRVGKDAERITAGYGTWQKGQTTVFNDPWEIEAAAITVSGSWTFDDVFTLVMRFYKTPFYQTFWLHFAGDKLTIQTRVNVGFAPARVVTMTGSSQPSAVSHQ
jgi:CubicO group peptidase (beta-lactamase class C family)